MFNVKVVAGCTLVLYVFDVVTLASRNNCIVLNNEAANKQFESLLNDKWRCFMGKAIPVIIGEYSFATKTEAGKFFSAMLGRYQPGDRVTEADAVWLHKLIESHPSAGDKIGDGIEYFTVRRNEWSKGFWLHRFDGTDTDWSYKECITPSSPEQRALAGFRNAVAETIIRFRDSEARASIGSPCPFSGIPITVDNLTVAHETSFRHLVCEFLTGEGISLCDVAVLPSSDGTTKVQLADAPLRERWCQYHQGNSRLMIVTEYGSRHRRRGPRG